MTDTQMVCLTIVVCLLIVMFSPRRVIQRGPGGHLFSVYGRCIKCGHSTKDDPKACLQELV